MRNSFISVTTISCTLGYDKGAAEFISRAPQPCCRAVMYSRSCQHAQVSLYSMNCVHGDKTEGPVRYLFR